MPVVDGLKAISNIMVSNPVPILVISDIQDSRVAFAALNKGALEVLSKSDLQPGKAVELVRKIKLLSKVIRHIKRDRLFKGAAEEPASVVVKKTKTVFDRVIAIASSTGGPKAITTILSGLLESFPYPILISI